MRSFTLLFKYCLSTYFLYERFLFKHYFFERHCRRRSFFRVCKLASLSWILLCTSVLAQEPPPANAPATPPATQPVAVPRQAATIQQEEQKTMKLLSQALMGDDKAHWLTETDANGETLEVLLVESPHEGIEKRGNIIILAAPGVYPYQARWYPALRQRLLDLGWTIFSSGLSTPPDGVAAPNRASIKEAVKTAELNTKQQKAYQENLQTWLDQSLTRGNAITAQAKSVGAADKNFLIAFGLSAHVAALVASETGIDLSGLVIVNLTSPDKTEQLAFNEKLTMKGPVLDIIFERNSMLAHDAEKRKRAAKAAGRDDYRLVMAPPGQALGPAAMSWLAKSIHGWAHSSQIKTEKN